MVKIYDVALNYHVKTLDIQCFPDLYLYDINGRFHERAQKLPDHEFIKQKLCFEDPRLRLNQQFFL